MSHVRGGEQLAAVRIDIRRRQDVTILVHEDGGWAGRVFDTEGRLTGPRHVCCPGMTGLISDVIIKRNGRMTGVRMDVMLLLMLLLLVIQLVEVLLLDESSLTTVLRIGVTQLIAALHEIMLCHRIQMVMSQ